MIIFFILVGVLMLGGGVATIIDGLPYLVLERGFTQVIVGAVAATGGLILLALSRVLAELRRVRATLSNAMMAISVASMSGEASTPARADLAVGAGLAAGVGATLVAAGASADGRPQADGAATETPAADETDEPDLFAQPLTSDDNADWRAIDAEISQAEVSQAEVSQTEGSAGAREIPASGEGGWTSEIEMKVDRSQDVAGPAFDALMGDVEDTAVPPPTVEAEPSSGRREAADLSTDGPGEAATGQGGRAEPWLDWPEPGSEPDVEPQDTKDKPESDDEFGFLRESLAGRGDEPEDTVSPASSEDGRRAGALQEAEGWMTSSGARREPWFEQQDAPVERDVPASPEAEATSDAPPALQPPAWPPQTRESFASEPAFAEPETEADGPEPEPEPAEPESEPEPTEATHDHPAEPVDETGQLQEPPRQDSPPAPQSPAASNEGIVGAYQVGDAHFTIFANGSIQARTPDGDYSFASMEELKTYLASEKSRLGV